MSITTIDHKIAPLERLPTISVCDLTAVDEEIDIVFSDDIGTSAFDALLAVRSDLAGELAKTAPEKKLVSELTGAYIGQVSLTTAPIRVMAPRLLTAGKIINNELDALGVMVRSQTGGAKVPTQHSTNNALESIWWAYKGPNGEDEKRKDHNLPPISPEQVMDVVVSSVLAKLAVYVMSSERAHMLEWSDCIEDRIIIEHSIMHANTPDPTIAHN